MRIINFLIIVAILFGNTAVDAQPGFYNNFDFNRADTLRGQLRSERTCYDVTFYNLNVKVNPEEKSITGYNEIHFKVKENFRRLQLDLYDNMKIQKIIWQDKELDFDREYNAVFVYFTELQKIGKQDFITVYYEGKPTIAKQPPWNGGFVWKKDKQKKHWIGVACEGDGASLWWPNKDHLSDEPDSMLIQCSVPSDLMCVANGNLRKKVEGEDGYTRFDWFVSYPIDNYNVSLNIADYAHFDEIYTSKRGDKLQCDYYVLKENLQKAKKQFTQTKGVLEAFEHYFGKYPFWNDGFALVETPYLGMEHQGAIAYGNKYKNGYLGTGGMNQNGVKADYIIVHEAAHEYFGNSVGCNDLAEMWIQESFATYMETLFIEYHYGKEKAEWYIGTQRNSIDNTLPLIGPKSVNYEHKTTSDHYYKGAWILHTLRNVIDNDETWFRLLKSFHLQNQISTIDSEDFFNHVRAVTGGNYSKFFNQYFYYADIPTFQYKVKKKGKGVKLKYRWKTQVTNFDMPIKVGKAGAYTTLQPGYEYQKKKIKNVSIDEFRVATELFLVKAGQE